MLNKKLQAKLNNLPHTPGVYFHKDLAGKIIYVGKAAVLKNRVRQYFHKSRQRDPKTDLLVSEIANVDWVETESEIDALFLEAELIKRYKPKYNIALRDDKSDTYVRLDIKSNHPTISYTRRPSDDGCEYIGPFAGSYELKQAMKLLRKIFPFDFNKPTANSRVSLDYHLGLSPGLEENKTSLDEYRSNLKKLRLYLIGSRNKLIKDIEKDMKRAAADKNYEKAAALRDQFRALKSLRTQVVFGDKEFIDISKDQALEGLAKLLNLKSAPRRIEGYDISHMHGQNNVASMVVFTNGLPDKTNYRKFKMRKPGNDDFGHIEETILRRFSKKNILSWPLPDLVLIDGGKGQLSSAIKAFSEKEITLPIIGLAKRREQIILKTNQGFDAIELDEDSHVRKLLTRIRDESHRFALSYQSTLTRKKNIKSLIEEIPGIGPKTRKKLIKEFGSIDTAIKSGENSLASVVGPEKAKLIIEQFSS